MQRGAHVDGRSLWSPPGAVRAREHWQYLSYWKLNDELTNSADLRDAFIEYYFKYTLLPRLTVRPTD